MPFRVINIVYGPVAPSPGICIFITSPTGPMVARPVFQMVPACVHTITRWFMKVVIPFNTLMIAPNGYLISLLGSNMPTTVACLILRAHCEIAETPSTWCVNYHQRNTGSVSLTHKARTYYTDHLQTSLKQSSGQTVNRIIQINLATLHTCAQYGYISCGEPKPDGYYSDINDSNSNLLTNETIPNYILTAEVDINSVLDTGFG